MTDFRGFNPDKNLNTQFNTNRQGKGAQPEKQADLPASAPIQGAPKEQIDPSQLLKLMDAQSRLNISAAGIENPSISNSMLQFAGDVTPERHARRTRIIEQAFINEFGFSPNADLLQEMVDDSFIGRPSIQNA
jgi:hypothetical protein